ncbi:MAG TPA: hypothetical protein VF070_32690 [Streptosporangiaceae bacterium]
MTTGTTDIVMDTRSGGTCDLRPEVHIAAALRHDIIAGAKTPTLIYTRLV